MILNMLTTLLNKPH